MKGPVKGGSQAARRKKKANPRYFPRSNYGRAGRLKWWIVDLFANATTLSYHTEIWHATKPEAERACTRYLCERKLHSIELSGPYSRQPTPETSRK